MLSLVLAVLAYSPPPLIEAEVDEPAPPVGVLVDVGVPDGAGATASYAPVGWLRLELGGIHNAVAGGIRGGVVLARPTGIFRPTLGLSVGRSFGGEAGWLYDKLGRVSYDFASAMAGLELGSRHAALFLRAGMSWVDGSVELEGTLQPVRVRLFIPSARLGLAFFFS